MAASTARIVPGRFEFFLEPAQVRDAFSVPFIWEQRIHGVDFSALAGTKLGHSPEHGRLMHKPSAYDHFLCEPEPLFAFDLHTTGPQDLPVTLRAERTVIRGGRLDGLCVCFRAYLDDEAVIDTSPFAQENLSWWIPLLRVESGPPLAPGDVIEIALEASDLEAFETWRWSKIPLIVPAASQIYYARS
jgi:protein arginine N-methyltransferase 1